MPKAKAFTDRIIVEIDAPIAEEMVRYLGKGQGDITSLDDAAAVVPRLVPLRDMARTLPVTPGGVLGRGGSTRQQVDLELELQENARLARGLVGFFVLNLKRRVTPSDVARVVRELRGVKGVRCAYRERPHVSAKIGRKRTPVTVEEEIGSPLGYIDPKPRGIGVRTDNGWVGSGAGAAYADIEAAGIGWNLKHIGLRHVPDAIELRPRNAFDPKDPSAGIHGTQSIGVISCDRDLRGKGIAPQSRVRALLTTEEGGVDGAIQEAARLLKKGDVLLLEVETAGLPVEVDNHVFEAIELATRKGIIVIEPAGNGRRVAGKEVAYDLDNLDEELAPAWTSRRVPGGDIPAPGSIMVGGCLPHASKVQGVHRRAPYSNFGRRVDCFAWAEDVAGVGDYSDAGNTEHHDRWISLRFSGTSAASAIIAGLVLLLQSRRAEDGLRLWTPADLRAAFLDAPGTSIAGEPVRFMPDFRSILEHP